MRCSHGFGRTARKSGKRRESISLYVGHTGEPLVGHTGEPLRYARVPFDVLADKRISARAVRVYAVIAGSAWQGNFAQVGKRRLSELAACSERLAVAAVKELVNAGHIERSQVKRGQRAGYLLTSPVFGQKQRDGVKEIVSSPRGGRRMVSVGVA